jgi:hypothetical protein
VTKQRFSLEEHIALGQRIDRLRRECSEITMLISHRLPGPLGRQLRGHTHKLFLKMRDKLDAEGYQHYREAFPKATYFNVVPTVGEEKQLREDNQSLREQVVAERRRTAALREQIATILKSDF